MIEISENIEEKLFGRRRISFAAGFSGATPSKDEIRTELSKKLNLAPDLTVITNVTQVYGQRACKGSARSYSSRELMERFEPKEGKKGVQARPAEEKKAAAGPKKDGKVE